MTDKSQFYTRLLVQFEALCGPHVHWLSVLSNTSALLWMEMERINWAGFYLLKKGELILGPYQGNVACTNIGIGKGVCGTAFAKKTVLCVADVHQFPGHIACDAASRSEIVLPLYANNRLVGVLDIDSPEINRFDSDDEVGLQKFVQRLSNTLLDMDF
ncbi:GAF domain-containing protein [Celerinatantimonas sp. YJH-8]|uniref:GAF domain-containing protein n=1 Tax=Celerinatantimonas sp. YJH-8 TaxID=3228714 RepID=UPI0038CACCC3